MVVGLLSAGVAALISRFVIQTEFNWARLIETQNRFVDRVLEFYQVFGTLNGLDNWLITNPPINDEPLDRPLPQSGNVPRPEPPQPMFVVFDTHQRIMNRAPGYALDELATREQLREATPIELEGNPIGMIKQVGGVVALTRGEVVLLARINRNLALSAVIATLFALAVGIMLARSLTKPTRDLTHAIRAMAQGQLKQKLPVRSKDELGELTAAFNQMSSDLSCEQQLRRQMTADIAHELRTPLTVICGYLEAMHTGALSTTPTRIQTVFSQATHLQHLVDDLRTLSLADAGELRLELCAVESQSLIESVVQAFEAQAVSKNIALITDVQPSVPMLYVDRNRMTQVLTNLVSNALRFTPAGGKIMLAAQVDDKKPHMLNLSVEDTGEGIAADVLPHIFKRFYRGENSRNRESGGSGLGLAIAASLVEHMGGAISAESATGHGSRFIITLPRAKQ